jgi:opacity protein-like surface antigen
MPCKVNHLIVLIYFSKECVMNKFNPLFVVLLVLLVALPASAQVKLGVIGGLNIADAIGKDAVDGSDLDISSRTAFGVGGVLDIGVSKNVAIVLQPMYLQKGAKEKAAEIEGVTGEATYKANLLEVPVSLKVSFGSANTRPYLLAGPRIGFILNAKAESNIPGLKGEVDFDELVESTDLGLTIGGGLNFQLERVSLFIEGQYAFGLTDVFKGGTVEFNGIPAVYDNDDVKTRGIQIMSGITFPLGGK